MSEKIKDKKVFSLMEVMENVRKTLTERYKSGFWVRAEMNKLNFYKHSGHCYPDLVEKRDGKIVTQMQATLWKDDYRRIDALFRQTLHTSLQDGVKILFLARIVFDASHGLALHILDIDPSYTLGDLEREKQETILRMRAEGIFDRNRALKMPLLPQRIAIISVETSKGYQDFLGKMDGNSWGYVFFHMLFPSVLQGEGIVRSISTQLNRIRTVQRHFDAVAIVRGGGGEVGLAPYNHYQLAREIALFPLPVLTGIGHITNATVTEMAAYKNLITPTDLADFFIQAFHNFSDPVNRAVQTLAHFPGRILQHEKMRFVSETRQLRPVVENVLRQRENLVARLQEKCSDRARQLIREETVRLENMTRSVNRLDPREVIKRGYSMTLHEGRVVRNTDGLKAGDVLKTIVYEGALVSTVQTIETKES
ncbi:MAG: exodeoxyribonuclease VII large subunit [Tannerella sp.]|jgi:exodeoxyribonuclease VII large subunit|nr:exodeoxyribonuclease VII large subunit [Tannerella sp.]